MKLRLEIPAWICFTVQGDNTEEILAKGNKIVQEQFGMGTDLFFEGTEGARLSVNDTDSVELIDEEDDDDDEDEDEDEET